MFFNWQKFKRVLKFVTLLRVEPYMVLIAFCLLMRQTTQFVNTGQVISTKIQYECRVLHEFTGNERVGEKLQN